MMLRYPSIKAKLVIVYVKENFVMWELMGGFFT